jgi:hypothetical protein
MASWSLLLVTWFTGLFAVQEPGAELVGGLDGPQPGERMQAAEQIAALGPGVERWLEKRIGKGSALHQRGVLLAAALLDTPEAHALLSDAARAGRRASPQRAWALLLYGMHHPEAGRDPARDWKRAATSFEGACLLAGYLGHEQIPDLPALRTAMGRKMSVRQQALLGLLEARAGQRAAFEGDDAVLRGARLLASVIPGQLAMTQAELAELSAGMPALWIAAARRAPGRTLEELRGSSLGGENHGAVFALREAAADQQAAVFAYLAERVQSEPAASWLWGLAGEIGIDLPAAASDRIPHWEASGLLRLALLDWERAKAAATARADVALAELVAMESVDATRMAPVVVLAIAGRESDRAWFQKALAEVPAKLRSQMQPLWLLAAGQFGDARAREALLADWALRFGAGTSGYLIAAGQVYTGLALLAGTEAADELLELRSYSSQFDGEHDHPISDEFYLDVAQFLFSAHYQWRFDL